MSRPLAQYLVTTLSRTPSGPTLDQDNPIGEPQQLRFFSEELRQAEAEERVSTILRFEGGGR